jgi:hypothetical protein
MSTGFRESLLGRETRVLTGREIDDRVAPSVVRIEVREKLRQDELVEAARKAQRLQEQALGELRSKGVRVPAGMVLIPAGEFTMGSGEGDAQPAHTVWQDYYFLDRHEVTNAQFASFVKARGYQAQGDWKSATGKDQHPVVKVSWQDAQRYCAAEGKRLPTEAEWEKATGASLATRRYPWGDELDAGRANYDSHGTKPVGSFPGGASPYGAWIWPGTCGSGRRTGMPSTRRGALRTPSARSQAPPVSVAVASGTPTRSTRPSPTATPARRTTPTTTSVSALRGR